MIDGNAIPQTEIDRFWARIKKTDTCWLWQGGLRSGYGQAFIRGKNTPSNRAAWMIQFGAIQAGMCVLHRCDVPACVRPDHLFLGTQLENIEDMKRKGRAAKGERSGPAKLTTPQVVVIKREIQRGVSDRALAAMFGVTYFTIRNIRLGRYWAHVQAPAEENV